MSNSSFKCRQYNFSPLKKQDGRVKVEPNLSFQNYLKKHVIFQIQCDDYNLINWPFGSLLLSGLLYVSSRFVIKKQFLKNSSKNNSSLRIPTWKFYICINTRERSNQLLPTYAMAMFLIKIKTSIKVVLCAFGCEM